MTSFVYLHPRSWSPVTNGARKLPYVLENTWLRRGVSAKRSCQLSQLSESKRRQLNLDTMQLWAKFHTLSKHDQIIPYYTIITRNVSANPSRSSLLELELLLVWHKDLTGFACITQHGCCLCFMEECPALQRRKKQTQTLERSHGGFHKWGYPQMDGFEGKIMEHLYIQMHHDWGYPYFRKPPHSQHIFQHSPSSSLRDCHEEDPSQRAQRRNQNWHLQVQMAYYSH